MTGAQIVYDQDGIVIWHGDCREVLPMLNISDFAVVVDPPYGIEHSTGWSKELYNGDAVTWQGGRIAGDKTTEIRDYITDWTGAHACLVFGSWKMPRPAGVRAVLIWDKGAAFGMGDLSVPWKPSWEEIYVLGSGYTGSRDEGVLKGFYAPPRISMGRLHPNEKPVSLCRYLISKLTATTIIDPCCGSGPVLQAAREMGRQVIGIEQRERWCEIAIDRLRQAPLPLTIDAPTIEQLELTP